MPISLAGYRSRFLVLCVASVASGAVLFGTSGFVRAAVLFELQVDPGGATEFSDAAGRHTLMAWTLPGGPVGLPPTGGSVVATDVLTPEGSKSVLLAGGWLEILSLPGAEYDFLFSSLQDLSVEFWFKSAGNGDYANDPSNPDRMHAFGIGDLSNNLDVDLGDSDPAPITETALWSYFGSGGSNAITDTDPLHDRNFFLDDVWHKYQLTRSGSTIAVYIDEVQVGSTSFSDALGSNDPTARNYIGRASEFTDAFFGGGVGAFPWFGYIGGVRVRNDAVIPDLTTGLLFQLQVNSSGGTPFVDATGRHTLLVDGVPPGAPGLPPGGGTVVPTTVKAPDGADSALFSGGWLEILSSPSTEADFLFAEAQNLTVDFWFRSAGNGPYDDDSFYIDRMHAVGLGDPTNNLDVDLGDPDPAPSQETALWTYFGGDGDNLVPDPDPSHDRSYYLDDEWHFYTMVREGSDVTVFIDGQELGSTTFVGPLGSTSVLAQNYIGRASLLTDARINGDAGAFPWFGYISSVRVFNVAMTPPNPVPALGRRGQLLLACLLALVSTTRLSTWRRIRDPELNAD